MALQIDATTRTSQIQQIATALNNGSIKLFSGSVPANTAASDPATTIATGTLPAALTASAGAFAFSNLSLTGAAGAGAAPGTMPTVARFYNSAGTTCIAQMTVTATGGGGDITLQNNVATGQTVTLTTVTFTEGNV